MQIVGNVLRTLVSMDAKPYRLDTLKGLDRYFDSPEYSDVTIRCRTRTFYAHRVVLGSQSGYFADVLRDDDDGDDDDNNSNSNSNAARVQTPATSNGHGGSAQAPAPARMPLSGHRRRIIDMHDENPRVVEAVLCFLYLADYRDSSSSSSSCSSSISSSSVVPAAEEAADVDPITLNMLVYDAAARFDVEGLKDCAARKMRAAAEDAWDSEGFLGAVARAYSMHAWAADDDDEDGGGGGGGWGPRGVLVGVAAEHSDALLAKEAFRCVLEGVEGFGIEFARAVDKRAMALWPDPR